MVDEPPVSETYLGSSTGLPVSLGGVGALGSGTLLVPTFSRFSVEVEETQESATPRKLFQANGRVYTYGAQECGPLSSWLKREFT